MGRFSAVVFLGAALVCPLVWSAAPHLTTILPRGAARGTEVEVRFTGSGLNDALGVVFHDPGITLIELVESGKNHALGVLSIAPDCAVGTHALRVYTSSGLSNLALFSVGALSEASESEPNNDPATAQEIDLGVTMNGVVTNEDVDYFAIDLIEGQTMSVEIEAMRLGHTLFDPKLRLFGPEGHERVAEDDTALMRQDAAFTYTAIESGRHVLAVSEASYGGSAQARYRLHVGTFPRPLAVTPMGGAPGATVSVRWLGDGVSTVANLTLPQRSIGSVQVAAFSESGVAPTPVPFMLSDLPGVLESEPNDTPDTATLGTAPGALDGVIQATGDVDWYRFEGKKGQVLRIRTWARALGSPLDSVMTVVAPSGDEVASDDDGAGMDSTAKITLPEDGFYHLSVRDHLRRGGETFAYRVHLTPPLQRMSFSLPRVESAGLSVPRGTRRAFVLGATRTNFRGPLSVELANLPEGVVAQHGILPGDQSRMVVMLTANEDAPLSSALTSIHGVFKKDALEVTGGFEQTIPLVYGRNKTVFHDRKVDRMAISVAGVSPFTIEARNPKAPIVHRGSAMLQITAHRAEGFSAPIKLSFPWLPKGIGGGTGTIDGEKESAMLSIEARGGAALGEHRLVVLGESAGTIVSTDWISIMVEKPWVAFQLEESQTEQGAAFEWVAKVDVSKPFVGTHQVSLIQLPKGVASKPQAFTAETTEIRFPVTAAADAALGNHKSVAMVAVLEAEGEPVPHAFSGAMLKVYAPLPPTLKKPAPAPAKTAKIDEKPKRRTRFPDTQ